MKVAFGHAIGSVDSDSPHHFERTGSFCVKSKTLVQERPMVQDYRLEKKSAFHEGWEKVRLVGVHFISHK